MEFEQLKLNIEKTITECKSIVTVNGVLEMFLASIDYKTYLNYPYSEIIRPHSIELFYKF